MRFFDADKGCSNKACSGENCATCGERIAWVQSHEGLSWQDAANKVADEFQDGKCDACAGRGVEPKEGGSTQGFAIFNFDDREATFTLNLPQRLRWKVVTNCMTKQTMSTKATLQVR